ncbi:MAG TPA: NAD(P)-dependent oxidoreductase [Bryobacteraceae bacterium]|nr:NAD(P)-dependent oxidoreductase [Bryobacteraceae bacterium]
MRRFYSMSTSGESGGQLSAGVLGLGIMGGAFARHLAAAGVETFGYDVLAARVAILGGLGAHACASCDEVARRSDIVITSLPSAAALDDVVEGIAAGARPGLLVVETSTLALADKERARQRLTAAGIAMLDAPISGTGPQAEAKDIAIFTSGDRAHFNRVRPILAHLARSVRFVGPFGAGSKLKYIANLLVAIHIAGAAEAVALGEKAGIDPSALVEILAHSAATSRMLEVRGPSMATGDYTTPMMKVDVFQKDLRIIAGFARESHAAVPLFHACTPLFAEAAARGMGHYDTAAVISVLRSRNPSEA